MSLSKEAKDTLKFYKRKPLQWEAQATKMFTKQELTTSDGRLMTLDNHTEEIFDAIIEKLTDEEAVLLVHTLYAWDEVKKKESTKNFKSYRREMKKKYRTFEKHNHWAWAYHSQQYSESENVSDDAK